MKTIDERQQRGNIRAIGVWENEGGAPHRDLPEEQYGRRIEIDRSWTVYHVFTGIPAHANGVEMTGLTRPHASEGMLLLNSRKTPQLGQRINLPAFRARQST